MEQNAMRDLLCKSGFRLTPADYDEEWVRGDLESPEFVCLAKPSEPDDLAWLYVGVPTDEPPYGLEQTGDGLASLQEFLTALEN